MKVLVVEDDRVLSDLLSFSMRREGFQVLVAGDGTTALQRWEDDQPDLILLDVNLSSAKPAPDGFAVCQKIRETSNIPIIFLTVRNDEDDIIRGLKLGADDYILKPFSPRQLIARIETVLRRAGQTVSPMVRQMGDLRLDFSYRAVYFQDGEKIALTPLEFRLFDYLTLNSGQILPFDEIIAHVWGAQGGDRDMLRQLVRRLRAKIEVDPTHPALIETVPALGYGFVKE